MKIMNISSLYPPNVVGGAEMGLQTMSEAMSAGGHDLHVVTLRKSGSSNQLETDMRGPVAVTEVPLANLYWPFDSAAPRSGALRRLAWHGIDTSNQIMARRVRQLVRRIRPDVVLTRNLQGFSTAVMPAIRQTGTPLVHVLHDYSLLCPRTTMFHRGRSCGMRSERCFGCRALTAPRRRHIEAVDGVIGVSNAVLDAHLQHGLFADRPRQVIYNALKPTITLRDTLAEHSGDVVFTFGFMGRIEPSKGIETLLETATTLERNGVEFRLLIAGRGDSAYIEDLQRRWPLRQTEFTGFVDASEFLTRLDTLVFPTLAVEALGNGVFEAFAKGVPVIGSRVGGIPESIDHETTGFIFKPGCHQELSNYLLQLQASRQLRAYMGRAALEKAREYLPENRSAEYIDFLQKIIGRTSTEAA